MKFVLQVSTVCSDEKLEASQITVWNIMPELAHFVITSNSRIFLYKFALNSMLR
jgi:hypothetical protein